MTTMAASRWIRILAPVALVLPFAFEARADEFIDRLVALQAINDGKPSDYLSAIKVSQKSCAMQEMDEFTRFECPIAKGRKAKLEVNVEWRSTSRSDWRRMTFWLKPESEQRTIRDLREAFFADWRLSFDSHQNVFDNPACGYRLNTTKRGLNFAVGAYTSDESGACHEKLRLFVFSIIKPVTGPASE
ncbi:hypothetical protein [Roseateles sp.]|uniref:hypothetical protein n=1 Tax=Roseateles sp. TaxID=1971397 RepID=UPI0031D6D55F